MKIVDLAVKSVASGDFTFKGEMSGFGAAPQVKKLRYKCRCQRYAVVLNKFGIEIAGADFETMKRFSLRVVTGDWNGPRLKAWRVSVRSKRLITVKSHGTTVFIVSTAKPKSKRRTFVKMLNNFSVAYAPDYPLGLFKMSAEVKTNGNVAVFNRLNANIGVNNLPARWLIRRKTVAIR